MISTLCRVNGPLSVVTIVVALVLAAWYLLRSALNRAPSRFDLLATAVFSGLVAVLVLVAVVGLFDGSRPSDIATFAGYLITTLALPANVRLIDSTTCPTPGAHTCTPTNETSPGSSCPSPMSIDMV